MPAHPCPAPRISSSSPSTLLQPEAPSTLPTTASHLPTVATSLATMEPRPGSKNVPLPGCPGILLERVTRRSGQEAHRDAPPSVHDSTARHLCWQPAGWERVEPRV